MTVVSIRIDLDQLVCLETTHQALHPPTAQSTAQGNTLQFAISLKKRGHFLPPFLL
jgi:hypothetical protein